MRQVNSEHFDYANFGWCCRSTMKPLKQYANFGWYHTQDVRITNFKDHGRVLT